jgi:hypothetical protein
MILKLKLKYKFTINNIYAMFLVLLIINYDHPSSTRFQYLREILRLSWVFRNKCFWHHTYRNKKIYFALHWVIGVEKNLFKESASIKETIKHKSELHKRICISKVWNVPIYINITTEIMKKNYLTRNKNIKSKFFYKMVII